MNWRNVGIGLLIATAIIALDQVSKVWLVDYMNTHGQQAVTSFFNLVMVWNRGISFGMFAEKDARLFLIGMKLVISVLLLIWLARGQEKMLWLPLGMIIGGALGNVIDRVRWGAVADFFDFHLAGKHWHAFNVADSAIVIGAGLGIAPFAFGMFSRAPGGGEMITDFEPYMDEPTITEFRGYLLTIDRAVADITAIEDEMVATLVEWAEFIAEHGVSDRVAAEPCNFVTDPLPTDCDVAIMASNLPMYSRPVIASVIRKTHAALLPGGDMHLIGETTNDDRTGPWGPAYWGLGQAISESEGVAHSESDVIGYFKDAGFTNIRVLEFIPGALSRIVGSLPSSASSWGWTWLQWRSSRPCTRPRPSAAG